MSGPFNLKDKIFCELFPDIVEVSGCLKYYIIYSE